VLRHAQEWSPSAQVKAAAAHVQTLKQNQRKKKLSLTYVAVVLPIQHCDIVDFSTDIHEHCYFETQYYMPIRLHMIECVHG
jgi:hypothetical protein